MKQTERNFWLDAGLFIIMLSITFTGFLLWLVIPHQTAAIFFRINRSFWLAVHIGSGLAGLAGNVIHIIWHRGWLKALRKRPIASIENIALLRSSGLSRGYQCIIYAFHVRQSGII
jgi:hypothetical protein